MGVPPREKKEHDLKWLVFSSFLALGLFCLCCHPWVSTAQIKTEWHLDVTLQEQYNDNLNLSSENPQRDFITTVSPGGQLLLDTKTGQMALDYHLNVNLYARNKDLNFLGHTANLDLRQALVRNLTLRLLDSFILSDEPREVLLPEEPPPPDEVPGPTEYRVGTRLTRSQYIRNSFQPVLEWRYDRDDWVSLRYRNEIYRNDQETTRDSTRDTVGLRGEHWFVPQWGLSYELSYTKAQFVASSDFHGQDGSFAFKHRLSPHTTVYAQAGFSNRDFAPQESIDYVVYRGALGAEHAFSPLVSGAVRAGYFFQVPEEGKSDGKPEGEASITVRWRRFQGRGYLRGGYTESYGDAENLGFGTFYATGVSFRYDLARHLFVGLDGSVGNYDFPSSGKRTIWQVRPSLNAMIFRWLTAGLEYHHVEQTTSTASGYSNNRFFFRITARY
ncbi:MAG: hypothetical protein WHX93_09520 [bacterium]